MPVEHRWESKQLLHTYYTGKVTADDLINGALEIGSDPRFDDLRYIIGDWTKSTQSTITVEDVEHLSAYISAIAKSNPRIKNVTVMNSVESRQALVSLYGMLTEQTTWEVNAFLTLKEAREWLSIE